MNDGGIFIIAELAQAHDGSLGIAHSFIDSLAGTGVNAVKFQTHIAEAESSSSEPFRTKFSYEDETRYDYWKRMEFTAEQWQGLKNHCDNVGLEFMSSPFSIAAVELLEHVGIERYKIGSGEVSNLLLLSRIGQTRKPVIMSSGLSSFDELQAACDILKPTGNHISILQCTTAYPTKPEQWGLHTMAELQRHFRLPIGFSDHSGDIFACLAATTLGARILEFHVTFDKRMFGPDASASLTLSQVNLLVKGVRDIEYSLQYPEGRDATAVVELKRIFGKSLAVNKQLKKGDLIQLCDLESKKPAGMGIPASNFQSVIGKTVNKDLPAYSFLTEEVINE